MKKIVFLSLLLSVLFTEIECLFNADDDCWSKHSKSGKFECCPEGAKFQYNSPEGPWGMVDGRYCGLNILDCPFYEIGYDCCPEGTPVNHTDSIGDWGLINDKLCGIIKKEKNETNVFNEKKKRDENNENIIVVEDIEEIEADESNEGNKENVDNERIKENESNVIIKENEEEIENCWAKKKGYKCCPKGTKPIYEDKDGAWGALNLKEWCGIIPDIIVNNTETNVDNTEFIDLKIDNTKTNDIKIDDDYCWVKVIYNNTFSCCSSNPVAVKHDQNGDWGYENGVYCGMRYDNPTWNDREMRVELRDEWNQFKNDWENFEKHDYTRLSVFAGDNETQLNFGWYSTENVIPAISICEFPDMEGATVFEGTIKIYKEINGTLYYANKVTVENLEHNKVYYYKRNINGSWDQEKATRFKTHNKNNYKFIFVGDPQIGGSTGHYSKVHGKMKVDDSITNDAFNWNVTVTRAFEFTGGEPALLLSAGDQIDTMNKDGKASDYILQENEYSGFLYPDLLRTIPSALSIGNHESYTDNWRHHFNVPNAQDITYTNEVIPGPNYFFKYNNALVIVLDSNKCNCKDYENLMKSAINKYPDAEWRIVMFHHDMYGRGSVHSREIYIIVNLRNCLTELIYRNNIDIVINGHDHVYSASNFITFISKSKSVSGVDSYGYSTIKANVVYSNKPNGTLYLTANCSTGSKLYQIEENTGNIVYDYIHYANQSYTATFGVLDFKNEKGMSELRISIHEVDSFNTIDGPYIFKKSLKCWSEPEFKCCSRENTEVFYSNNGREWGIENNTWCAIPGNHSNNINNYIPPTFSPPVTTTTTTVTTTTITTVTSTSISTTATTICTNLSTTIATTIPTFTDTSISNIIPTNIISINTLTSDISTADTTITDITTTDITTTDVTAINPTTTNITTMHNITANPTATIFTSTITQTKTKTVTTTTENSNPTNCIEPFQQCGGNGYTGPTCCKGNDFKCIPFGDWFSMCTNQY